MAYLVGAVLALAVGGLGTVVGLDRDRAFYPTVMMVIASYYALFAVMGGSTHALFIEAGVATVFLVVTLVGFKYSLWLVVAALALHGILDVFHGQLIANSGVPVWWPAFCLTYDVVAAAYLAVLLLRRVVRAQGAWGPAAARAVSRIVPSLLRRRASRPSNVPACDRRSAEGIPGRIQSS